MFGAVFKGLGITYFMQKISVRPTPDIDLLKIKDAKPELSVILDTNPGGVIYRYMSSHRPPAYPGA